MAVKYLELTDEGSFNLTRDEGAVTGVRTFMQYDDHEDGIAAGDLPVVGVSKMVEEDFTTEIDNCICRRERRVFSKGHQGSLLRVFEFSTNPYSGTGRAGNVVPKDSAARSFSLNVEQVTVETGTSDGKLNRFEFEGAAVPERKFVNQTLTFNILSGSLDIPNENQAMTQEELEQFIATQRGFGKSVNHAAFQGYAIGQVRYDGFSGGEFYNKDGELRFAVELHFSTRMIGDNLAGTAITQDDWLYELNEQEGLFRKVKNHNTGKYLYEKKDFSELLAGPTVPPP